MGGARGWRQLAGHGPSPLARAVSSGLCLRPASILDLSEKHRPHSLENSRAQRPDRHKHRPQVIPGTRLRSNPPPVRFLDRFAEPRTALPARLVTQPLARQIANRAVQTEFLGAHVLGPDPELSLPRSPFETSR